MDVQELLAGNVSTVKTRIKDRMVGAKVGIYIYIEEITNIEMSLTNIIS